MSLQPTSASRVWVQVAGWCPLPRAAEAHSPGHSVEPHTDWSLNNNWLQHGGVRTDFFGSKVDVLLRITAYDFAKHFPLVQNPGTRKSSLLMNAWSCFRVSTIQWVRLDHNIEHLHPLRALGKTCLSASCQAVRPTILWISSCSAFTVDRNFLRDSNGWNGHNCATRFGEVLRDLRSWLGKKKLACQYQVPPKNWWGKNHQYERFCLFYHLDQGGRQFLKRMPFSQCRYKALISQWLASLQHGPPVMRRPHSPSLRERERERERETQNFHQKRIFPWSQSRKEEYLRELLFSDLRVQAPQEDPLNLWVPLSVWKVFFWLFPSLYIYIHIHAGCCLDRAYKK